MINLHEAQFAELLSSNFGWLKVPRAFFHMLKINEALFLAQIIDLHYKALRENKISKDGWFYASQDYIFDITSLTKFQQRQCKRVLIGKLMMEAELQGVPSKLYYKLKWKNIAKAIQKDEEIILQKGAKYI